MLYERTVYRLNQVSPEAYKTSVDVIQHDLDAHEGESSAIKMLSVADPQARIWAELLADNSFKLDILYKQTGGDAYLFAAAVGLHCLAAVNRFVDLKTVGQEEWEKTFSKERLFAMELGARAPQDMSLASLDTVASVNPGYVQGFEHNIRARGSSRDVSYAALGAVHAHDLMHFASLRPPTLSIVR